MQCMNLTGDIRCRDLARWRCSLFGMPVVLCSRHAQTRVMDVQGDDGDVRLDLIGGWA